MRITFSDAWKWALRYSCWADPDEEASDASSSSCASSERGSVDLEADAAAWLDCLMSLPRSPSGHHLASSHAALHRAVSSVTWPDRSARPDERTMAADFRAMRRFVATNAGGPAADPVAHYLQTQACFVGLQATPNGVRRSGLVYVGNQLWLGAAPQAAALLYGLQGTGRQYLVTPSPRHSGSVETYLALLWKARATTAVALVDAPWWPRVGHTSHHGRWGVRTVTRARDSLPSASTAWGLLANLGGPATPPTLATLSDPNAASHAVPVDVLHCELIEGDAVRPLRVVRFAGWPDFGALHGATLAGLVALMDDGAPGGVIAVHCLGGAGRTGTLVCAAMVAQSLRATPTAPSPYVRALQALLALRCQYPRAIETSAQFMSVLAATAFLRLER